MNIILKLFLLLTVISTIGCAHKHSAAEHTKPPAFHEGQKYAEAYLKRKGELVDKAVILRAGVSTLNYAVKYYGKYHPHLGFPTGTEAVDWYLFKFLDDKYGQKTAHFVHEGINDKINLFEHHFLEHETILKDFSDGIKSRIPKLSIPKYSTPLSFSIGKSKAEFFLKDKNILSDPKKIISSAIDAMKFAEKNYGGLNTAYGGTSTIDILYWFIENKVEKKLQRDAKHFLDEVIEHVVLYPIKEVPGVLKDYREGIASVPLKK